MWCFFWGELGAGKTVLAKGLGRGMGVDEDYAIVSPTFTLLNVYPGRLAFYHADLYRLSQAQAAELEFWMRRHERGVGRGVGRAGARDLWPAHSMRVEILAHCQDERRRAKGPGRNGQAGGQLEPIIYKRDRGILKWL